MTQHLFATDTAPTGAELDGNFNDVYSLSNAIQTSGYSPSSPKAAIDATGNLIFGATVAATTRTGPTTVTPRVQASGVAVSTGSLMALRYNNDASAPGVFIGKTRGAAPNDFTIVQTSDALGTISFAGSDGVQMTEGATIRVTVDATPGVDTMPARMTFSVNAGSSTTPTARLVLESGGTVRAAADNAQSSGSSAARWSTVYAATGTINTSDAREKTSVTPLTTAEIAAAKALAAEIGTYQWLAAMQAKGADARTHVGMTVQRAMDVMTANGLDPLAYGFICHDTWEQTVNDDDSVIAAGDRYAFRPDELLLFLARGFDARLAALEAH